jgi:hypothetical protein
MKVFDIINEAPSSEPAVGFINKILKAVAWSVGKGARARAAEDLASAWAAKMVEAGSIRVSMPTGVIKDATLAADRAIMDEAYKEAVKAFRKAERAGLIKDIKAGAAKAVEATAKYLNYGKWLIIVLSNIASLGMGASLIKEYIDDIENEMRLLKEEKISPEEYVRNIGALRLRLIGELGLVLATQLTAGVAAGAASSTAWFINFITFKRWAAITRPISGLFAASAAVVQTYFVYELSQNKWAREQLLDLILSDNTVTKNIVGLAGSGNDAGVDHPFIKWAKEWFSEYSKKQQSGNAGDSGSTSPSGGSTSSVPSGNSGPSVNQSGKDQGEQSSGIDWSTVK